MTGLVVMVEDLVGAVAVLLLVLSETNFLSSNLANFLSTFFISFSCLIFSSFSLLQDSFKVLILSW